MRREVYARRGDTAAAEGTLDFRRNGNWIGLREEREELLLRQRRAFPALEHRVRARRHVDRAGRKDESVELDHGRDVERSRRRVRVAERPLYLYVMLVMSAFV